MPRTPKGCFVIQRYCGMAIIVEKFGGTSVADSGGLRRAARLISAARLAGNSVVAVVSAQGDTTDKLLKKAAELSCDPCKRELDALLSSGEQASMALLAIAAEAQGCPAVSLSGPMAGISTDGRFGEAEITEINTERIKKELSAGRAVIIAGFQGSAPNGDIATLGRGGSDTSAVALAAALGASVCKIYTDVDGVYTADPRKDKAAKKLEHISYDDMLLLSKSGAQVLHPRAAELAKKHGVRVEVLSSFDNVPGTVLTQ